MKDTLACLEMGAVETLIVWESLEVNRYELMNSSTGELVHKNLGSEQVGCPLHAPAVTHPIILSHASTHCAVRASSVVTGSMAPRGMDQAEGSRCE